jgi:hypothetical protein
VPTEAFFVSAAAVAIAEIGDKAQIAKVAVLACGRLVVSGCWRVNPASLGCGPDSADGRPVQ